jgi:hypothetical protein
MMSYIPPPPLSLDRLKLELEKQYKGLPTGRRVKILKEGAAIHPQSFISTLWNRIIGKI